MKRYSLPETPLDPEHAYFLVKKPVTERWSSRKVICVGMVASLTVLGALAVLNPHFRGILGFKIKFDGIELQVDKR